MHTLIQPIQLIYARTLLPQFISITSSKNTNLLFHPGARGFIFPVDSSEAAGELSLFLPPLIRRRQLLNNLLRRHEIRHHACSAARESPTDALCSTSPAPSNCCSGTFTSPIAPARPTAPCSGAGASTILSLTSSRKVDLMDDKQNPFQTINPRT